MCFAVFVMLTERCAKGNFLGINLACYTVLDLQNKVTYVPRTVEVFDGKFLSTEECRFQERSHEEEPCRTSLLQPTPARL
jgi:hypothetical protein